ncbi:SGNH/GDSL hydrolase family protein [Nocardioides nanhaiensis]|uniref:SGNH/GDSL hydrolase family protein n=1 Tax=Nocardioides nanhaiensis TaxID=1476871 RepID=A0ABP8W1Q9_9ACTN
MAGYLRVAALGDSATVGVGDPVPGGWRGWARLLAEALAATHDLSFCSTARVGATAHEVRADQLEQAVAHRPQLASLVVGVNDTMRSSWDPARLREDLTTCAAALTAVGATLLTVRYHDHAALLGLPGPLARAMAARLAVVNGVYDHLHARHGGVRVDLAAMPGHDRRELWSVDRLHPSERGHRALAAAFADRLRDAGHPVAPVGLEPAGGLPPSWRRDLGWVVAEGGPWVGRRARDLGPWAVRQAWSARPSTTRH